MIYREREAIEQQEEIGIGYSYDILENPIYSEQINYQARVPKDS